MQPRLLYGSSLAVMAVLVVLAGQEPPLVLPEDAGRFEGQNVRMEGLASEVRADAQGGRFTLVRGDAAVGVRATGDLPPNGAWVAVEGRIMRSGGRLTIFAEAVEPSLAPEPIEPGWGAIALEPEAWTGRMLRLGGELEGGTLVGEGRALSLGDGPWPGSGKVTAVGSLAYDAACICHRFHAIEVSPWTP